MQDNNLVKKFLTHKSGQFVFSRDFDSEIISQTFIEARILYRTIIDLPVLPHFAAQIDEELIIKSISGTAAIEGNPLNQEEVGQILSSTKPPRTTQRAYKEILNLKAAYGFAEKIKFDGADFLLTEELIKTIHGIITQGLDNSHNLPGHYRNGIVEVGNEAHGGIYKPPKIADDIEVLMKLFIAWINSDEVRGCKYAPYARAGLAHYHLALIHPFSDGNGRTARLIEGVLLRAAGIKYLPRMLSNYYYTHVDDYYWAFSSSIKNRSHDVSPFMEFYFRGILESLQEIRDKIICLINRLLLRDYFDYLRKNRALKQRQRDLLGLLLDYPQFFSIEDLFEKVPYKSLYSHVSKRTASRDLKELTDRDLLFSKDGKFSLNVRALEKQFP